MKQATITNAIEDVEIVPSDIVDQVVLVAATNQNVFVPAGANHVVFSGTGDFFAKPNVAATVPPSTTQLAASQVWQIDDPAGTPVFVDETVDFNDADASDVDPWPVAEAIGDQMAIGYTFPFRQVNFTVGTLGTVGTTTWKYWNGTAFVALTVTDGTTGFTASGNVTFDIPLDWAKTTINGSASLYFIVAEVLTLYTINPVITQGFIVNALDGSSSMLNPTVWRLTDGDTPVTSIGLISAATPIITLAYYQ